MASQERTVVVGHRVLRDLRTSWGKQDTVRSSLRALVQALHSPSHDNHGSEEHLSANDPSLRRVVFSYPVPFTATATKSSDPYDFVKIAILLPKNVEFDFDPFPPSGGNGALPATLWAFLSDVCLNEARAIEITSPDPDDRDEAYIRTIGDASDQLTAARQVEAIQTKGANCNAVRVSSGPAEISTTSLAASMGLSHILLERASHISDTISKYQKGKYIMATLDSLALRSELGDGSYNELGGNTPAVGDTDPPLSRPIYRIEPRITSSLRCHKRRTNSTKHDQTNLLSIVYNDDPIHETISRQGTPIRFGQQKSLAEDNIQNIEGVMIAGGKSKLRSQQARNDESLNYIRSSNDMVHVKHATKPVVGAWNYSGKTSGEFSC